MNGDHNLIALTREGKVFYCGIGLDKNGGNLAKLREFDNVEMEPGEYFVDIAVNIYGTMLLSSK